jgi:hypothetical protein
LSTSYNLIVTHKNSSDFQDYFITDSNGNIIGDKKVFRPRFQSTLQSDGKVKIVNSSAISSVGNNATFTWHYADQSTSTGLNPLRTLAVDEAINVTVNDGDGNTQTLSPLACSVELFPITQLSNNNFLFGPMSPSAEYYIKWVFNDGTVVQANSTTKVFTSNGWVRCEAWRIHNNTLACQFTKDVIVKCGDKKSLSNTLIFEQSNQRWKLDGTIWVQTGEVGSRVKYLRWRGAILGWMPADNQVACADLSGTYVREVFNPNRTCLDITASGSYCLGNGTWPTSISHTIPEVSGVFSKPIQLSAGLGIKVNGTWRGWGYAGKPRLVLP